MFSYRLLTDVWYFHNSWADIDCWGSCNWIKYKWFMTKAEVQVVSLSRNVIFIFLFYIISLVLGECEVSSKTNPTFRYELFRYSSSLCFFFFQYNFLFRRTLCYWIFFVMYDVFYIKNTYEIYLIVWFNAIIVTN